MIWEASDGVFIDSSRSGPFYSLSLSLPPPPSSLALAGYFKALDERRVMQTSFAT